MVITYTLHWDEPLPDPCDATTTYTLDKEEVTGVVAHVTQDNDDCWITDVTLPAPADEGFINGIYGLDADNVWFVGGALDNSRFIMYWDGNAITEVTGPVGFETGDPWLDVWAYATDDLWVTGGNDLVFRWDGVDWTQHDQAEAPKGLVEGCSGTFTERLYGTDVCYSIGLYGLFNAWNGEEVARLDATNAVVPGVNSVPATGSDSEDIGDIWVNPESASIEVWGCGNYYSAYTPIAGLWSGSGLWTETSLVSGNIYYTATRMCGFVDEEGLTTDVWISGDLAEDGEGHGYGHGAPLIVHCSIPALPDPPVWSTETFPAGGGYWGNTHHYPYNFVNWMGPIGGLSNTDLWCVLYRIYKLNAGATQQYFTSFWHKDITGWGVGPVTEFERVGMSDRDGRIVAIATDDVWFAYDKYIYRYAGAGVTEVQNTGTGCYMHDAYKTAEDHIYFVGDKASIWFWNGTTLTKLHGGTDNLIPAIGLTDPDGYDLNFYGVWAPHDDYVMIMNMNGQQYYHYDGSNWTRKLGLTTDLIRRDDITYGLYYGLRGRDSLIP